MMRYDFDDVFEALGNEQRRRILLALFEDDATGPGEDGVIATDGGTDSRNLSHHHVHLPKLDDHGFVTWRRDENSVVRGPRFDEVEPMLELLSEHRAEAPDSRK